MHSSFPGSLIRGTGPVSEMIIYVSACAHLIVNGHLSLENLQLYSVSPAHHVGNIAASGLENLTRKVSECPVTEIIRKGPWEYSYFKAFDLGF